MGDPQVEELIRVLAQELHERLNFCLTHNESPEHDAALERARNIFAPRSSPTAILSCGSSC